ncbi:Ankyrin repeat-containing domain protein [Metarhizium robertsii ARSEF 23]|nr:Ankyrin repeat-containing domain protein [Metarhizium robertsii ARSEF 23]EFZ03852.2 Ankyrin repeat-containing domain protein [Metarhizium robertsii ARSEF 23]
MSIAARYGTDRHLRSPFSNLNTRLVEYLLRQGADPAVFRGDEISSVYSVAFLPKSLETCRVLSLFLEAKTGCRGVNLNPFPYGSPLQVACYVNRQEHARILLSKGAEVNATSGQLGDAMQSASRLGHGGLVTDLLQRGGDADSGQDSWPRAT